MDGWWVWRMAKNGEILVIKKVLIPWFHELIIHDAEEWFTMRNRCWQTTHIRPYYPILRKHINYMLDSAACTLQTCGFHLKALSALSLPASGAKHPIRDDAHWYKSLSDIRSYVVYRNMPWTNGPQAHSSHETWSMPEQSWWFAKSTLRWPVWTPTCVGVMMWLWAKNLHPRCSHQNSC